MGQNHAAAQAGGLLQRIAQDQKRVMRATAADNQYLRVRRKPGQDVHLKCSCMQLVVSV